MGFWSEHVKCGLQYNASNNKTLIKTDKKKTVDNYIYCCYGYVVMVVFIIISMWFMLYLRTLEMSCFGYCCSCWS